MKVAVIGSGVSGLMSAYLLQRQHEVTVFESSPRIGGHVNTVSVDREQRNWQVDTGFIVYNERTYPLFVQLLSELKVATQESTMSFAVRNDGANVEYNGNTIGTLFAQKRNVLRPRFFRMIRDILRFNREALQRVRPGMTLGQLIEQGGYSEWFRDNYLLPMGAAVWSTSVQGMLDFPAEFFVKFFDNHGMLSVDDRPIWRVISGGSKRYVEALTASFLDRIQTSSSVEAITREDQQVRVRVGGEEQVFDHVVLAVHADQALKMLSDPSDEERAVLGAFPYNKNKTWLHTDASLMPKRQKAWAAWNYLIDPRQNDAATVSYNMNILQGLAANEQFMVTLNATDRIDRAKLIEEIDYEHPLYTTDGPAAQARHGEISNQRRTHYCGAYWRNGFHEDGMFSAVRVAEGLGVAW